MLLLEFWADIPGYYGYQASYSGKIRTLKRIIQKGRYGFGWCSENILTQSKRGTGYLCIELIDNTDRILVNVHRLIATSFHPNPENLPQVNHLDGIKINNWAANLEWTTAKGNMQHASKMGLLKRKKRIITNT